MYLYINPSLDCYYNLALEEYLLRKTNHDYIVLWRSNDSVVIGKHQNLHAEVIEPNAIKNQIKIARRLSGGGTVFHDLGNLNFTFIKTGNLGKLVDFKSFIEPINQFLVEMGVPAELSNRNDIMINGKKVSGNAEHVFKNRVLHHGTLLFNSDLVKLNGVLRKDPSLFKGRGVQSVRKPVTRILDFLPQQISIETFIDKLSNYLSNVFLLKNFYLDDEQKLLIKRLSNEKYKTKEWVYDYSPSFELNKIIDKQNINIKVKAGKIEEIESQNFSSDFLLRLKGMRFDYESLKNECNFAKERVIIDALFY